MTLRNAIDSPEAARAAAQDQDEKREAERQRIRAKLSDTDRDFLDAFMQKFPGAKLKAIHFNDGEKIGVML